MPATLLLQETSHPRSERMGERAGLQGQVGTAGSRRAGTPNAARSLRTATDQSGTSRRRCASVFHRPTTAAPPTAVPAPDCIATGRNRGTARAVYSSHYAYYTIYTLLMFRATYGTFEFTTNWPPSPNILTHRIA